MSAPESRPDMDAIESTLADAFARRHTRQRPSRPSLIDVRRRAQRRAARRATMRASAVVAAGASAVAGGWAVTRDAGSPEAVPAQQVGEAPTPAPIPTGSSVMTLTVDGLWAAVAFQLGTTVDELRALNPGVDFAAAPAPGASIAFPSANDPATETSVRTVEATDTTITGPPETFVRTLPETATTISMPGTVPPPGWMLYEIVAGDYIAKIAEDFCTTAEEIVAANGWPDLNLPIYPGDLIAVPADAC
jgi:LysM repeat protein